MGRFVASCSMICLPSGNVWINQAADRALFGSRANHAAVMKGEDHLNPNEQLSDQLFVILVPVRVFHKRSDTPE